MEREGAERCGTVKSKPWPGVGMHAFNPSTQEADGHSEFQDRQCLPRIIVTCRDTGP